jgi:hypothetical protein
MIAKKIPSFLLFAAMLLSACKTVPITPQTISGRYEMIGKPEGLWYSGESLVLGDGTFQYWLFTDLADDPRLARYPVSGRYTLDGRTITLHDPAVLSPQRTIKRLDRRFTLWTPKQAAVSMEPGRIPDDVLVQKR